jgi:hypothetical protein
MPCEGRLTSSSCLGAAGGVAMTLGLRLEVAGVTLVGTGGGGGGSGEGGVAMCSMK